MRVGDPAAQVRDVNASLDLRFLLLGLATGAAATAGAIRALTFLLPSRAVPSGPHEPAVALPPGATRGLDELGSRR